MALMRSLRMLRAACQAAGGRQGAITALDAQVEAVVASATAAGLTPEEIAALRAAATPR
jgi:hypothetical protein